jgi:hypothetical protein
MEVALGWIIKNNLDIRKELSTQTNAYEDVSKSIRTGRLERELQLVQLSATVCSCIAIL